MAVDAGTIYSSIRIRLANLSGDIASVKSKLNNMVTTSAKQSKGFAGFWKGAFQTAFGFGAIQLITRLVGAIKNAIGVFSGFQQSMKNVQSVTQAVGEEYRKMEAAAKKMGETTRFTARESADALYFLGSAGFSAQQSIEALDGVLQLAGATQSDLASTAESVAAIISQYSLEAAEATRVSNVFAAAIGNSQATMQKLTDAYRQVGPVAAGFGMTIEETTGALQLFFNAGFKGQQAGRGLKSALADLAAPTANMRKIFAKLGIELNKVNPEFNSLDDIIDVLGKSGATTSDIISTFGKVAGPQMAVLIREGGNALREYTDAVTNTEAAAEAYAIQNDSLAGSIDFLKSKLESTAISLFEKMEPGMRDLIDTFITLLDTLKPVAELLGFVLNLLFKMVSFLAKIAPVTKILEGLLLSFKNLKTPMEKTAENFDKVRESLKRISEIDTTINKLEKLTDEFDNLSAKTNLSEEEQKRLKEVIKNIGEIVPDATTAWDAYGNAIEISTEKTKEAGLQLLKTREALLLESKTRLEIQKPILRNILRLEKADAEKIKTDRENIAREANIAERRLSVIETFRLKYNKAIKDEEESTNAFLSVNAELEKKLKNVGITLGTVGGKTRILGQGFKILKEAEEEANDTLNKLIKTLDKESEVELRVRGAEETLQELADLEKQLTSVRFSLKKLKETETETDAPDIPEEMQQTWKDFLAELKKATEEAKLFGDKQDVLKAKIDFLKKAYLELKEQGLEPTGVLMTKIRNEYDKTVTSLDNLIQKEKDDLEAKEKKEKIQTDINKIIEDYNDKLLKLGKTEDELIDIQRNAEIAIVEGMKATDDATRAATDAINNYYDKLKENSEEATDEFTENTKIVLDAAEQLATALIGLFSAITESRLEDLDRQMKAEIEAAGLSEETEKEKLEKKLEEAEKAGDEETAREAQDDLDRLAIEEKYEKQKAEIQYKAALMEWNLKMLAGIASAAQAVLSGFSTQPFIPAGLAAGALAGTLGGIEIASIAYSKPKAPAFESGGLFLGPGHGDRAGAPAMLHAPEMVLNSDQMGNLFDAINSGNLGSDNQSINVTAIYQVDGIEMARITERAANNGQITFKPDRALRK